jgi:hypothetical protein
VLRALVVYSDLIGGVLGILGSVVLAIPFVSEATDRREWQLLIKFKREVLNASHAPSPEEAEAHRQIRERIVDYRLGQYERFRMVTVWGFALLFGAFIFMTVASIERGLQSGHPPLMGSTH